MSFLSGKKLLLIGFITIMLVAIPATLWVLQQQQNVKSKANPSTTLSLLPATQATTVGQSISYDIYVDPGTNQVSFAKFAITYDPTKLDVVTAGTKCGSSLCPETTVFPLVVDGPTYTSGNIAVSLSVGADPTKAITTKMKIATLTLKAKDVTTVPAPIAFGGNLQVLSVNCGGTDPQNCPSDQPSENVLSTTNPATVTIGAGAITPTPVATASANMSPICNALNLDRTPSGTVPFSLTFTANGTDSDGTVSKVTFDFGDGPTQDVTSAGGIGTNNVSVQVAHTYRNVGTYKASAVFMDNKNAVSTSSSTLCQQTIVVSAGTGGAAGTGTGSTGSTSGTTLQLTSTPIPAKPTIPATGPNNKIIGIGFIGTALAILGGMLVLGL